MQDFYFQHELVQVPVELPEGFNEQTDVTIIPKGTPDDETATAPLEAGSKVFELGTLGDYGIDFENTAESPVRIKFDERIKAQPPPEKHPIDQILDKYEGHAELSLDFGHDKLTITISNEGGGGAGEGAEAATGESVTVTGNVKFFWAAPLFPVSMFYKASGKADSGGHVSGQQGQPGQDGQQGQQSSSVGDRARAEVMKVVQDPESIGMFMRFCLRFLYHSTDAVRLAVHFVKTYEEKKSEHWTTKWFGFTYWLNVFLLFAIKDAVADLANKHPQWVADLLAKLEFQFELNALASLTGTAYVNLDVNETVSGKVKIPLATLLVPVIDALCASVNTTVAGNTPQGETTEPDGEAGEEGGDEPPPGYGDDQPDLIDLISPYIRGVVEDRFCMKLGGFPAAFEVESRGTLASGTFGFPPDSPLRAKMRDLGKDMAQAAIDYKKKKTDELPPEEQWLTLFKALLDQLDKQIEALVINRNFAQAFTTAVPFVQMVMGKLQEEKDRTAAEQANLTPPAPREEVRKVLELLGKRFENEARGRRLSIRAISLAQGQQLGVSEDPEDPANGPRRLFMFVDDDDKARASTVFEPPGGWLPDPEREVVTFKVPLNVRPSRVAWNTYTAEDGTTTTGIIAGFDRQEEVVFFSAEAGVPPVTWNPPGGLHYKWVTTTLARDVEMRGLSLPHVKLDGSTLLLRFWLVRPGEVDASSAAFLGLADAAATERMGVWRLNLLTDATAAEELLIRQRLAASQMGMPWSYTIAGSDTATWYDDPAGDEDEGDDDGEDEDPTMARRLLDPWPTYMPPETSALQKEIWNPTIDEQLRFVGGAVDPVDMRSQVDVVGVDVDTGDVAVGGTDVIVNTDVARFGMEGLANLGLAGGFARENFSYSPAGAVAATAGQEAVVEDAGQAAVVEDAGQAAVVEDAGQAAVVEDAGQQEIVQDTGGAEQVEAQEAVVVFTQVAMTYTATPVEQQAEEQQASAQSDGVVEQQMEAQTELGFAQQQYQAGEVNVEDLDIREDLDQGGP